jgi:hypothetical protein
MSLMCAHPTPVDLFWPHLSAKRPTHFVRGIDVSNPASSRSGSTTNPAISQRRGDTREVAIMMHSLISRRRGGESAPQQRGPQLWVDCRDVVIVGEDVLTNRSENFVPLVVVGTCVKSFVGAGGAGYLASQGAR